MKLGCEAGYLQIANILFQHAVFHFPDRPAFHTDQMQMRFRQSPQFVLNRLGIQLMPHDHSAVFQHIQCIVKRSLTHMEVCFFEPFLE